MLKISTTYSRRNDIHRHAQNVFRMCTRCAQYRSKSLKFVQKVYDMFIIPIEVLNMCTKFVILIPTCDYNVLRIVQHVHTKFRTGRNKQIFELIGPPRANKENLTPCQCIPILLTPQGGRGQRPPPPVLSIALEYMGMVLDFPCLASEAQLFQKSVNTTLKRRFELKLGPNRFVSVQICLKCHSRGLGTDPGTGKQGLGFRGLGNMVYTIDACIILIEVQLKWGLNPI